MVRSIPLVTYSEMIEHVATDHRKNSQHQVEAARQAEHWRNHVEDGKTVKGRLRLEPRRLTQGVAIRAQGCSEIIGVGSFLSMKEKNRHQ